MGDNTLDINAFFNAVVMIDDANSLKSLIQEHVLCDIILPAIRINGSDETKALNVESLRSYTLILQAYNESMEDHSKSVLDTLVGRIVLDTLVGQAFDATSELSIYALSSTIEFIAILIQVSPSLVIDRHLLMSHIINLYIQHDISETHASINNDMLQVIGQYFQLFVCAPFEELDRGQPTDPKAQKNDKPAADADDEDEDVDDIQNALVEKRTRLAASDKPSPALSLQLIQKILVNNQWSESTILLLGVICSYASTHHPSDSQVIERIYNLFLDKLNQQDSLIEKNRDTVDTIIHCLAFVFTNTPRSNTVVQRFLPLVLDSIVAIFTSIRAQMRDSQSKQTKKMFLESRDIFSRAIGKMLRIFERFSSHADDFLSFAHILAEPLVLSDFIYAIVREIKSTSSASLTDLLVTTYLPNAMNPLTSQLKSKHSTSFKLCKHIIRSIQMTMECASKFVESYCEKVVELMVEVMSTSWKCYEMYSAHAIPTLARVAVITPALGERIWRTLLAVSKFIALEEMAPLIASNPPTPAQQTELFTYLLAHIGNEQVTFESEIYLRMAELGALKSLLQASPSTFGTAESLKALVKEMEHILVAIDEDDINPEIHYSTSLKVEKVLNNIKLHPWCCARSTKFVHRRQMGSFSKRSDFFLVFVFLSTHSSLENPTHKTLACIYAALLLQDDGIAITADKIKAITESANVVVASHWPGLYARVLAKSNVEDLIMNFAAGAAAPAAAAGAVAAPAAAAAKKEAPKKVEVKEESDDDMGMGLFD
eukprot:gene3782-4361_t